MEIKVRQLTDIDLARLACSYTMGGKESNITLDKLAGCEHSPLRAVMFAVEMKDIPTFVSVHLVRHKFGVEHFVKSNREDLPGYTGDTGRDHPVNHLMILNAQAILNIAHKRLCHRTHEKTREVVRSIVDQLPDELKKWCVPDCQYRGDKCYEPRSCGWRNSVWKSIKHEAKAVDNPS